MAGPATGPILFRPASARSPDVYIERRVEMPQSPSSPDPNILRENRVKKEMRTEFYSSLFGKEQETLPPFLPKSRFPTVPPQDVSPPGKWKRPLTCPQKWIAQQEEKSWFENSDFRTNLNEAEKRNIIMCLSTEIKMTCGNMTPSLEISQRMRFVIILYVSEIF